MSTQDAPRATTIILHNCLGHEHVQLAIGALHWWNRDERSREAIVTYHGGKFRIRRNKASITVWKE